MLILVYVFISAIFFKVLPEFLFDRSATVSAAIFAAVASGGCMFACTYFTNLGAMKWLSRRPWDGGNSFPTETIFPFLAATAAAVGLGWLCFRGFAPEFVRGLSDYKNEPLWFLVMLAIPPAVHYGVLCADVIRLARRLAMDDAEYQKSQNK